MRLALTVTLVLSCLACRRSSSTPVDAGPAPAASSEAPCGPTTVIAAKIQGRFESTSEGGSAPKLVVAVDMLSVSSATPPNGGVASIDLAAPRFAAEYSIDDLCTDDGSTSSRLAVSCIGRDGKITRLVVARDGDGLIVTEGKKQWLWEPPGLPFSCFELHGLARKGDLAVLQKAWELDEPKCPRKETDPPVKMTFKVDGPKAPSGQRCRPDASASDARVSLLGAGAPRELGLLPSTCGLVVARRWSGVNGLEIQAVDSGTVKRIAYQLGDRVYTIGDDGRARALELPCGSRAQFGWAAPGLPELREVGP